MKDDVLVSPVELLRFVTEIFLAAGVDAEDAAAVADHLVLAQRRGHPSHGMVRVAQYLGRLRGREVMPRTELTMLREAPGVAMLDGGNGWGVTIGRKAMAMAIAKAKVVGIALVAVKRCTHVGMLSYYTELATKAGMVGFCMAGPPRDQARVAPWGGREPRYSTNPLSFGVPADSAHDVILDMATTQVAQGKIMVARAEGKPIPHGWALDGDGNPTTDPAAAMSGLYLPLGGYKGYGLAAIVDLLCGLLSGDDQFPEHSGFDKLFGAINLAFFQPLAEATERVDRFVDMIKDTPRLADVEEIVMPGEPEAKAEAATRDAVAIGANVWRELLASAEALGVAPPSLL